MTFLTAGTTATCANSCFNNSDNTYKITWSAADIAGRMGVQTLKLDRKVLGDMQDYSFKVTFETASGQKVGDWGSFMIAGLAGDTVNIFGPGFVWDSSNGDLVLKLSLAVPGAGGVGGFGGFGGGAGLANATSHVASQAADEGIGMLNDVRFPGMIDKDLPAPGGPDAAVAVAPEPQSWGLMLLGFGVAGGLLRTRRQVHLGQH